MKKVCFEQTSGAYPIRLVQTGEDVFVTYNVHMTMRSKNAKTGPIPVSTTTAATCPATCPFNNGGGCYAASGPLAMHWRKVTDGSRGVSWEDLCVTVAMLPESQIWRHNQAGDLPGDGEWIDWPALYALVNANTGRKGFTYTHYPMTDINASMVAIANDAGFTINLSADNLAHADELVALGAGPVAAVVPIDTPHDKPLATPAGHKVIVCPATYRDDVSCATCQLCQKQDRPIIAFPAHGTGRAKANATATI